MWESFSSASGPSTIGMARRSVTSTVTSAIHSRQCVGLAAGLTGVTTARPAEDDAS
jgi:hypothetical protein